MLPPMVLSIVLTRVESVAGVLVEIPVVPPNIIAGGISDHSASSPDPAGCH